MFVRVLCVVVVVLVLFWMFCSLKVGVCFFFYSCYTFVGGWRSCFFVFLFCFLYVLAFCFFC